MERLTAVSLSRCVSCGYISHDLESDRCPECGRVLHLEAPEAHWICPVCSTIAWASEQEEQETVPLE
jgi:hypothetical protein